VGYLQWWQNHFALTHDVAVTWIWGCPLNHRALAAGKYFAEYLELQVEGGANFLAIRRVV
jgi:hypothetical protein